MSLTATGGSGGGSGSGCGLSALARLPNTITGGLVAELPPGGGVLVLGVQDVKIEDNEIEDNDFFGIALIDYCVAVDGTSNSCGNNPPYYEDTSPEDISIVGNTVTGNGGDPPPGIFAQFAGDLLALGGSNNCASDNMASIIAFMRDAADKMRSRWSLPIRSS